MVADSVASVRRESRIWVQKLIGEGHATVRRNRRAAEEELMVEALRGACVCAEKGGAAMKHATCLIGLIIAASLMTMPAVAGDTQRVRALDAPAAVKVDAALDRGDHAAAVAARRDAYGAASAARSWQALLAVGDASLRIGDAMATQPAAVARARFLYLHAFLRARSQHAVSGMVDAAERVASLGDHEVAAQCLAAARSVVAHDDSVIARLDAVAGRLAAVTVAAR
jgi:hypothetical protein